MDPKEIKNALKDAREAIRIKNFKEALKHCKLVIKADKNNYNAWVFIGVAAAELDQPEQAEAAYRRAIDNAPEQILAWQGLCGFYEKGGDTYLTKLVDVYGKLKQMYNETDNSKMAAIEDKLTLLHIELGNINEAIKTWECMKLTTPSNMEDRVSGVTKKLAQYLVQQKSLSVGHSEFSDSETAIVMKECKNMLNMYPDAQTPLKILCRVILKKSVEETIAIEEAESVAARLDILQPPSGLSAIINGVIKMKRQDYLNALELLQIGIGRSAECIEGWLYLSKVNRKLYRVEEAQQAAAKGIQLVQEVQTRECKKLLQALRLVLAESLALQRGVQLSKAEEIYTECIKMDGANANIKIKLGYVLLQQGKVEQAMELGTECMPGLPAPALALIGWVHLQKEQLEEAEQSVQQALEEDDNCAWYNHQMGIIHWKRREERSEKSFALFLKAAKLDPYFYGNFLYLGHFYAEVVKDLNKARRCYQKAYDLNKQSEDAAIALSDTYRRSGEHEANLNLLKAVTGNLSPVNCKWAWLRLGLAYLDTGNSTAAVTSFQAALRTNPTDFHCWECLGDAYTSRGSHTAAMKAYSRALELSPDSVYCMYQVASIKQIVGLYADAISEYKLLLQQFPDYVPAMRGFAEASLLQARAWLQQYFHGRVLRVCQDIIDVLTMAVNLKPGFSCLWKLMADACMLMRQLPADVVDVVVPAQLLRAGDSKLGQTLSVGKADILSLASKCYGRALRLLPDCCSLWQDLGTSYYYRMACTMDSTQKTELGCKALQSLKKAVTISPQDYRLWSALGVIAACQEISNPRLAQHAFIKSIDAEKNNVIAWTNLGALYLIHENCELAHEAFKVAQALDPSYVYCWVGQAMIAECVGNEEAMDLFRHTTELCMNMEGAIGYANWVCKMLQGMSSKKAESFHYSNKQLPGILGACDAMAKYTDRNRGNSLAYIMYGLLLEHLGLYTEASRAFSRAAQLLEESSEHQAKVRLNLARILCKLGRYVDAVQLYQTVTGQADFESICGMGLALYQASMMKESYQAYEKGLQICPEDDKSHVLVAMALVAYKFNDIAGAKSVLFKSSLCQPVSTMGLLALCALGCLQRDDTLAQAALHELHKHRQDVSHVADITTLLASLGTLLGRPEMAVREASKHVHAHPHLESLWFLLGEALLKCSAASERSFLCAQKALHLSDGTSQMSQLLASLCGLAAGNYKAALQYAQRAVHQNPGGTTTWTSLLACCIAVSRSGSGKNFSHFELCLKNHILNTLQNDNYVSKIHEWVKLLN
ncbi:PREDICTED: tetratricopeptide repeat protein 37-like isoform X2 [Priapulus caudatus]|uniref:Tetratricopeptide repeat protein 37-like isoform X2 n=1 Tax=Priapulus caudatus TaxID=37621 RepID=A0ABM1ED79_PRICU|nr:PREDICTED: tetratricopeptide repeat protein 37-like isoform X2 [Priapulus caudatus]